MPRSVTDIIDALFERDISMTNSFKALTALALLLMLSACGQSGPLYIPGNPSEVREPPPETSNTSDEDEEDRRRDDG